MNNAGSIRRLLAVSLASASIVASAEAAPAPVVTASPSHAYQASIARVGADASGFARYEIEWQRGDDRGTARISSEVQRVASFAVLDDGRAIIVGPTSVTRISAFHVFGLSDAKTIVVDECYAPATSPGGRYIAYVRIHPQPVTALGRVSNTFTTAEYRVMDLAADGSVSPRSYAIALQRPTSAAHAHALAMPIVWESDARFSFGDRFAGHVERVFVEMDASGRPAIRSAVAADS